MNHNRRTKTGLIGEYASFHTPCNCHLHTGTDNTAADCFHGKCTFENSTENSTKLINIDDTNNQGTDNIDNSHKWNKFFCYRGNSFDSAQNYKCCQSHQNDTGNKIRNTERSFHISGNGIDLAHITDTEGCQQTEQRKQNCQNCTNLLHSRFGTETIAQIVHGTAAPFTFRIFSAVIDTQNILRIIGHHSEKCHDPHPENCSRSSKYNCSCNPNNVSSTNSCCKSRTKTLKLRNRFIIFFCVCSNMFIFKNRTDSHLYPMDKMGELKTFVDGSHQNSSNEQ